VEGILIDVPSREFVLAGSLEELKAKGRLILHVSNGKKRRLAVQTVASLSAQSLD
jgi:hypothetical protein